MKNYVIEMTEQEIQDYPFLKDGRMEFYRFIVERATGRNYDEIENIDCRKILIASNILESWFAKAEEEGNAIDFSMNLLMSGPKEKEDLKDGQVELMFGCMIFPGGESIGLEESSVLKTIFRTNARCPKCGSRLYTSDLHGYGFLCKECDENFYSMEIAKHPCQDLEIFIPITAAAYKSKLSKLQKIAESCGCASFGYDSISGTMDIGWDVYEGGSLSFPISDDVYNLAKQIGALFDGVINETWSQSGKLEQGV